MKKIKLFINILITVFLCSSSFSDEIQIESTDMEVINEGKTSLANNAEIIIPKKSVKINGKSAKFEKEKNILIFSDDVLFEDNLNDIVITGNFIKYERIEDLIHSKGKTKLKIENDYVVNSKDIFFDRKINKIYTQEEALIEDSQNNFYILKNGFELDKNNEILKSNKSIILDKNNNKYFFENLLIDLKIKEIAGKELKVEFENSYFGNEENQPLLKGRSSYSNNEELKVYKAVFSTCNTDKKNCRGWELMSDEFTHDKNKKIFEYKNSWLKVFDYNFLYLPYFNHPDPSVKEIWFFNTFIFNIRKPWFSVNIPYFKILSSDKDITFNSDITLIKFFTSKWYSRL